MQQPQQNKIAKILSYITLLESQTHHKHNSTAHLHSQVHNLLLTKSNLTQTLNSRLATISQTLDKLYTLMEIKLSKVKQLKQQLVTSTTQCDIQMSKMYQLALPQCSFSYEIGRDVRFMNTLENKIAEVEEFVGRDRQRREDQIRSLKIRISLGQIELKQLRNRTKK